MSNEVENFIKKAEDKLISSKILYDAEQYATSVSASYYCMFITAKALLIKKGCNVGKTHAGLIKQFSLKYVKEENKDNPAIAAVKLTETDADKPSLSVLDKK